MASGMNTASVNGQSGAPCAFRGPGNELGVINNKVQKEFSLIPSDGFTHTHSPHSSLTLSLTIQIAVYRVH